MRGGGVVFYHITVAETLEGVGNIYYFDLANVRKEIFPERECVAQGHFFRTGRHGKRRKYV